MLRPSGSMLGSSRAARRAYAWGERRKFFASGFRALVGLFHELIGFAVDLVLLVGLPVLYLAAAYFVVDLPARWIWGGQRLTLLSGLLFAGGIAVSLVGLARVLRQAQPVQPVTPQFARRALVAGWFVAVMLTVSDLAS